MRAVGTTVNARAVARASAGVAAVIAMGALAGLVSAREPDFAILAALLVLVTAIAFIDLTYVLVIAFMATFLFQRVGPMSISDLALGGATLLALLMVRGRGAKSVQPLLWAGGFYLALTLPQLVLNRYVENYVEWVHQAVLVLGSILVGFVIGREGKARLALSLYVFACLALSVAAIASNLTGGNGFVGMWHKNAVGFLLMYASIIAFANPPWLRWKPQWAFAAFALCAIGMLSSRQAIVGMLAGILVVGLRPRTQNGKRSHWMLLLLLPAAWFVYLEVVEQLAEDNPFNSAAQRLIWYGDSITVWLLSPLYGVGHRWWTTWHTGFGGFQPPNAELDVLTTTGVIGLIGFLAMFVAALWVLGRLDPVYGTLGLAIVFARLVQSQFDLYWVASAASVLWIIAGICYGVREHDRMEGITWEPHPVQTIWRRTRGVRI